MPRFGRDAGQFVDGVESPDSRRRRYGFQHYDQHVLALLWLSMVADSRVLITCAARRRLGRRVVLGEALHESRLPVPTRTS